MAFNETTHPPPYIPLVPTVEYIMPTTKNLLKIKRYYKINSCKHCVYESVVVRSLFCVLSHIYVYGKQYS